MKKAFLAIDIGASSGKAFLGKYNRHSLELEEILRFPNDPVCILGHICWDVLSIYENTIKALHRALAISDVEVYSVGIDTWGVDFGLLDENGHLIENPYHYRDCLTNGVMNEVTKEVSKEKIFHNTATHFQPFNSLFQLIAMREKDCVSLKIAKTMLMMPNLLMYFLTGKKTCEFTIATTTQLYDPIQKNWSRELIKIFDLPNIFPKVFPSVTMIGKTIPFISKEIGRSLDVVLPATHDTGSAVAGTPIKDKNSVFISTGTWCIMGVENDEPIRKDLVLKNNFTNEGCLDGRFRISKNITGLWLVQECLKEWKRNEPQLDYNELNQLAARATPLKCIIDPNDPRFIKPLSMVDMIRDYCRKTGQPQLDTKGEIVRTCFEGIALRVKWTLDVLREITKRDLNEIYMVGGGTKSILLCQLISNATGLPVFVGPTEATAIGNLLGQMIAEHELKDVNEGRELIKASFELKALEPDLSSSENWQKAYENFLSIRSDL